MLGLAACDSQDADSQLPKHKYQYKQRIKEVFFAKNFAPREIPKAQVILQLPNADTPNQEVVVVSFSKNSSHFVGVSGEQTINVELTDIRPKEKRKIEVEYDLYVNPLVDKSAGKKGASFTRYDNDIFTVALSDQSIRDQNALVEELGTYWESNSEELSKLLDFDNLKENIQAVELLKMALLANSLSHKGYMVRLYLGWTCKALENCLDAETHAWVTYEEEGKDGVTIDAIETSDDQIRVVLQQVNSVEETVDYGRVFSRARGSGISIVND